MLLDLIIFFTKDYNQLPKTYNCVQTITYYLIEIIT